eukprot:13629848-Alexandrium_andersonii.AAC.1
MRCIDGVAHRSHPTNDAQQQMHNRASGCSKQFRAVSGGFLRSGATAPPPQPPPKGASGVRRSAFLG